MRSSSLDDEETLENDGDDLELDFFVLRSAVFLLRTENWTEELDFFVFFATFALRLREL